MTAAATTTAAAVATTIAQVAPSPLRPVPHLTNGTQNTEYPRGARKHAWPPEKAGTGHGLESISQH